MLHLIYIQHMLFFLWMAVLVGAAGTEAYCGHRHCRMFRRRTGDWRHALSVERGSSGTGSGQIRPGLAKLGQVRSGQDCGQVRSGQAGVRFG